MLFLVIINYVFGGAILRDKYPLFEHDYNSTAITEPSKIYKNVRNIPERAVLVFYQKVIDDLLAKNLLEKIDSLTSETGIFPIYRLKEKNITVMNSGLGAPFSGAVLEELIVRGVNKCIACGSAGVLNKNFERGSVVVVSSAVRDEGTSYHYLEPSREVQVENETVKIIESVLDKSGVPYTTGKTWTTDAIYRETKEIIKKRISEGCITVEMEASALIAISKFRNIKFGQILSCGDDVSGEEWNKRVHPEAHTHKEKLFWLAVDCCLSL